MSAMVDRAYSYVEDYITLHGMTSNFLPTKSVPNPNPFFPLYQEDKLVNSTFLMDIHILIVSGHIIYLFLPVTIRL